jgi:pentapeptide MXKDX repeat protein
MGICFLAVSLAAVAQSGDTMKQDTMKPGDQMKQDNMKADNMTKKAVSVSGKVSDDGKMFASDKDNKTWTVSNPEALKGHEGHHVTVYSVLVHTAGHSATENSDCVAVRAEIRKSLWMAAPLQSLLRLRRSESWNPVLPTSARAGTDHIRGIGRWPDLLGCRQMVNAL